MRCVSYQSKTESETDDRIGGDPIDGRAVFFQPIHAVGKGDCDDGRSPAAANVWIKV